MELTKRKVRRMWVVAVERSRKRMEVARKTEMDEKGSAGNISGWIGRMATALQNVGKRKRNGECVRRTCESSLRDAMSRLPAACVNKNT